MFSSKEYWEERYSQGGNSGKGSYGDSAILKAKYINSVIDKYNIKTINELGHGDGNQLSLLKGFDQYNGYDVSSSARNRCIDKFKDNGRYTFLDSVDKMSKVDLAMSIDVIYHLTEWEVYEQHIKNLFKLGKYILIYGMNMEINGLSHVKARPFNELIERVYDNYSLLEVADGSHIDVKFYLYGKM